MRSRRGGATGTLVAGAVLALLIGCGGGGGGGGDTAGGGDRPAATGPAGATATTVEPVAALALAFMDERPGEVGEYRDLLATLQDRCHELPNRIADFAVDAQRRMADHGREESMRTVLRAMVAALPPDRPPADCAAVAIAVARELAP